jgi:hypothetical protein
LTKDGGIDLEYRLADPSAGAVAPPARQDWAEVERILYTDTSGKECGIDLDTGKLYALPKEYNRVVYPRDEIVRWAKDHRIDLFYPAKPGAAQLTCVELGLKALDDTTWEKATREDMRDFFRRLGTGKMDARRTMLPVWVDPATGAAPSHVYAFVTNEGTKGIVQMVGTVGLFGKGSPSGVKIRYRIERPAAKDVAEVRLNEDAVAVARAQAEAEPISGKVALAWKLACVRDQELDARREVAMFEVQSSQLRGKGEGTPVSAGRNGNTEKEMQRIKNDLSRARAVEAGLSQEAANLEGMLKQPGEPSTKLDSVPLGAQLSEALRAEAAARKEVRDLESLLLHAAEGLRISPTSPEARFEMEFGQRDLAIAKARQEIWQAQVIRLRGRNSTTGTAGGIRNASNRGP